MTLPPRPRKDCCECCHPSPEYCEWLEQELRETVDAMRTLEHQITHRGPLAEAVMRVRKVYASLPIDVKPGWDRPTPESEPKP